MFGELRSGTAPPVQSSPKSMSKLHHAISESHSIVRPTTRGIYSDLHDLNLNLKTNKLQAPRDYEEQEQQGDGENLVIDSLKKPAKAVRSTRTFFGSSGRRDHSLYAYNESGRQGKTLAALGDEIRFLPSSSRENLRNTGAAVIESDEDVYDQNDVKDNIRPTSKKFSSAAVKDDNNVSQYTSSSLPSRNARESSISSSSSSSTFSTFPLRHYAKDTIAYSKKHDNQSAAGATSAAAGGVDGTQRIAEAALVGALRPQSRKLYLGKGVAASATDAPIAAVSTLASQSEPTSSAAPVAPASGATKPNDPSDTEGGGTGTEGSVGAKYNTSTAAAAYNDRVNVGSASHRQRRPRAPRSAGSRSNPVGVGDVSQSVTKAIGSVLGHVNSESTNYPPAAPFLQSSAGEKDTATATAEVGVRPVPGSRQSAAPSASLDAASPEYNINSSRKYRDSDSVGRAMDPALQYSLQAQPGRISTVARPPSRQKLAAQHLFDAPTTATAGPGNSSKEESAAGGSLDVTMRDAGTISTAVARQYDPISDGFSEYGDCGPSTFKIIVNRSLPLSARNPHNYPTAASDSSKGNLRSSNLSVDTKRTTQSMAPPKVSPSQYSDAPSPSFSEISDYDYDNDISPTKRGGLANRRVATLDDLEESDANSRMMPSMSSPASQSTSYAVTGGFSPHGRRGGQRGSSNRGNRGEFDYNSALASMDSPSSMSTSHTMFGEDSGLYNRRRRSAPGQDNASQPKSQSQAATAASMPTHQLSPLVRLGYGIDGASAGNVVNGVRRSDNMPHQPLMRGQRGGSAGWLDTVDIPLDAAGEWDNNTLDEPLSDYEDFDSESLQGESSFNLASAVRSDETAGGSQMLQLLSLESSLGEDFLSLFAPG